MESSEQSSDNYPLRVIRGSFRRAYAALVGASLVMLSAVVVAIGMRSSDTFYFFLAGVIGGAGLAALAGAIAAPKDKGDVTELLIRIQAEISHYSRTISQHVPELGESKGVLQLPAGGTDWENLLIRDPQLAMAKVRIELEAALNRLAADTGVQPQDIRFASAMRLTRTLRDAGRISDSTASALDDVLRVCNLAIHGQFDATVDAARDAVDLGQRILLELESVPRTSALASSSTSSSP
jgi:hypothetical protein